MERKCGAEYEREVLTRFKNGKRVEKDEYPIVESYSKVGITKLGFSFTKKETQASLTKSGKRILGLSDE